MATRRYIYLAEMKIAVPRIAVAAEVQETAPKVYFLKKPDRIKSE